MQFNNYCHKNDSKFNSLLLCLLHIQLIKFRQQKDYYNYIIHFKLIYTVINIVTL